jgi:ComF family protein
MGMAMRGKTRRWQSCLQSLLMPTRCVLCHGPGVSPLLDLCAGCFDDLPALQAGCRICARPVTDAGMTCGQCQKTRPPFDRVVAPYRYAWPMDKMIQQFKFSGNLTMGRVLGTLLALHLQSGGIAAGEEWQSSGNSIVVVPVPLHRRRLRERGFNQANELGRSMGRVIPINLCPDLCERVRDTPAQSGKKSADRVANVRQAFALRVDKAPDQLILLDDVMTTGSTCAELATTFRMRGTRTVIVWCLARA